jgi:hypothetical protein
MADYLSSAIAIRNRQRPLRKISASIRAGFSRRRPGHDTVLLKNN